MAQSVSVTLVDQLANVPDFRRREGRRYPLPALLIMIILAIMSGRYGYREIARFLQTNQKELVKRLGLKRKQMPSHVTIRTVLMGVDFDALNAAFRAWVQTHVQLDRGDWIALDAKAIRSTVSDYDSSYQDFVSFVSAFAHHQGIVLGSERYQNKQTSEQAITDALIPQLIDALGLQGVVFTLDAYHCKKNTAPDHRSGQSLSRQSETQPTQAAQGS